jgi:hypothetical protein
MKKKSVRNYRVGVVAFAAAAAMGTIPLVAGPASANFVSGHASSGYHKSHADISTNGSTLGIATAQNGGQRASTGWFIGSGYANADGGIFSTSWSAYYDYF